MLERDNDALKEEVQTYKFKSENLQIQLHEKEVKVEGLSRDYQKTFDENMQLKDLTNILRDQKDQGLSEVNRLKHIHMERVNELNDDYNTKLASTENTLIDTKERQKYQEERTYSIMIAQERIADKWKNEHKKTVAIFEQQMRKFAVENKALKEQIVELKGSLLIEKENTVQNKRSGSRKKRTSKSKERKEKP